MNERTRLFPMTAKALGARQVETILSTAAADREDDRIDASGWDLAAYRANPVILWSHDATQPPIARSVEIEVRDGALRSLDEFPPEGVYPLADVVHDLVRTGFIRAKSVGFRPLEWERNAKGGVDFFRQELLEHSYVSVPANPEAIVVARSKGFDGPALDTWFGRLPSDIVLVLRDGDGNPNAPGRPQCPGPSGVSGGSPPCPHRFPRPVSECPGQPHCPLLGQNVADTVGRVLAELVFVVDDDAVRVAMRRVVEAAVHTAAREWNMKITGRID